MRIYYTTDKSVDDNLEQLCPFGETSDFEERDGRISKIPKYVGSIGCTECPYCYGKGFKYYYGVGPNAWILIPDNLTLPSNFIEAENLKLKLGLKQFRTIDRKDYIKCAKCFNEKFLKKNKKLRFKIWWYHHLGKRIYSFNLKLSKFYFDIKYKIYDSFN